MTVVPKQNIERHVTNSRIGNFSADYQWSKEKGEVPGSRQRETCLVCGRKFIYVALVKIWYEGGWDGRHFATALLPLRGSTLCDISLRLSVCPYVTNLGMGVIATYDVNHVTMLIWDNAPPWNNRPRKWVLWPQVFC